MKNYTTQTAALKATKVDTRLLEAKQIDTEKLFINGELFDPSQIKESPNHVYFALNIVPNEGENGSFYFESLDDQFSMNNPLIKISENPYLDNLGLDDGIYAVIFMTDEFSNFLSKNTDTINYLFSISDAKFSFVNIDLYNIEQCIFENYLFPDKYIWAIKICEEDDNLSELYGGITEEMPGFTFLVSIPYYIPENNTSSSTYSLRKTNLFENLRQRFEEIKQQNLDKSAE